MQRGTRSPDVERSGHALLVVRLAVGSFDDAEEGVLAGLQLVGGVAVLAGGERLEPECPGLGEGLPVGCTTLRERHLTPPGRKASSCASPQAVVAGKVPTPRAEEGGVGKE